MDINKILKSDYLDILFEGRNKAYGGYDLRKKYPQRMRNAGIIVVGVTALIVGGSMVAKAIKGREKKPVAIMKEVTLAEPPPIDEKKQPPPPPPPPPPPVKPTVKFTPPVIKKDEEVREEEKPPEVKELEDKSAGIKTQEGDPNALDPGITEPGTGVVAAPPPPEIFKYVEQMPEAPYDVSAYMAKNIRYPDAAREAGIDGRVNVQFVVSEDGSIGDVRVVGSKRLGGGLEDEAVRVVKGMPNWKPGKQNGRPVKVYYTLPVMFRLE
ncbi:energy transducer TonB [Polluticoccus soli]|uniref:energy transducer TonB n=1 Tax=Polluticoccus soli TaxID=3034150 RepID=UPI0023E0DF01|nr:energy transducer TonB [Flavipsychrobacter sp. JY13-12]